ncbi:toprim domain-containing protein [Pasteuria penetrans]|uniref:toprim domain-containing protein n=1 Tax=Pasteuria penetrans TaxID=86005 RepID=UPI000FA3C17F|nr:DUF4093 domain-containing protein [Pasteuria penetrans]
MIGEIIVVEGIRDAAAVRRAIGADTLVVRGVRIHGSTLSSIRRAQTVRGAIVLTDPDHAGRSIRRRIADCVEGVLHAYLSQDEARRGHKFGVEYASPEVIRSAVLRARSESGTTSVRVATLSWEAYRGLGFVGSPRSRRLREKVAELLRIGYGNGKQFYGQLCFLRVSREELMLAWEKANSCVL